MMRTKKTLLSMLLGIGAIFALAFGATAAFADFTGPAADGVDAQKYARVTNGEFSPEVSEIAGAYPYDYAGESNINWIDYPIVELNQPGNWGVSMNNGVWLTHDSVKSKCDEAWLRFIFGAKTKVKQFVLYAPGVAVAPQNYYFEYSEDAEKNAAIGPTGAATTISDSVAWQTGGSGSWARVPGFSETQWKAASVTEGLQGSGTWTGVTKTITFDKAVDAKGLKFVITENGKQDDTHFSSKISLVQMYKLKDDDTTSEVYSDLEFYTSLPFTAEASSEFTENTPASNLSDNFLSGRYDDKLQRNANYMSEDDQTEGHSVVFTPTAEGVVGGVRLFPMYGNVATGAGVNNFPVNFKFQTKDGDAWIDIPGASVENYAVMQDGWQDFIFDKAVSGPVRLFVSDTRQCCIAEARLLATDSREAQPFVYAIAQKSGAALKTDYQLGESADLSGKLDVSVCGADDRVVDVTAAMLDGFDTKTEGTLDFDIVYEGFRIPVSATVSLKAAQVDHIAVVEGTLKTDYDFGEGWELEGAKLKVTTKIAAAAADYADVPGYSVEAGKLVVTRALESSMIAAFAAGVGDKTAELTYLTVKGSFAYHVSDVLDTVAVKAGTLKAAYEVGDSLDLSGAKLTLSYKSGASEEIAITAAMVTGFDGSKAGDQTLTVTYEGKTAQAVVKVSVKEPEKTGCGSVSVGSGFTGGLLLLGLLCTLLGVFSRKKNQ